MYVIQEMIVFPFYLESFACFNGGDCVYWRLCDCSRYNATGAACQLGEWKIYTLYIVCRMT